MKRRGFLGGLFAAPAAAMASQRKDDSVPTTVEELTARIESLWPAVEGPPMAYFEALEGDRLTRVIYTVICNTSQYRDVRPDDVGRASEEEAVHAAWLSFAAYADGRKGRLYWRIKPQLYLETEEARLSRMGVVEVEPNGYVTEEVAEDRSPITPDMVCSKEDLLGKLGDLYYVRMRLAISEAEPVELMDDPDHHRHQPIVWADANGQLWRRIGQKIM